MFRKVFLGLALFSGVAFGTVIYAPPSQATPGMVDASGCHGHPRHCHHGGLRVNSAGRRYVPGAFGHHGHRRHHRRHHH